MAVYPRNGFKTEPLHPISKTARRRAIRRC